MREALQLHTSVVERGQTVRSLVNTITCRYATLASLQSNPCVRLYACMLPTEPKESIVHRNFILAFTHLCWFWFKKKTNGEFKKLAEILNCQFGSIQYAFYSLIWYNRQLSFKILKRVGLMIVLDLLRKCWQTW